MTAKRVGFDPAKVRAALALAPDATDDAVRAAVAKAFPAPRRRGPTMTPQQAYDTGRLARKGFAEWERRYAADPDGVGQVLASLAPVLADERKIEAAAARGERFVTLDDGAGGTYEVRAESRYREAAASDTPLLDDLEAAVYGESREDRYRREDLQAEAELREQLEAADHRSASAMTDDEVSQLFGSEE
ncbi:MAG: hypothetical protein ACRDPQ_16130 [Nocardioidaceae bacterium]